MRDERKQLVFLTILLVSALITVLSAADFTGFASKKTIDRPIKFVETIPPEMINYECPLSFELAEPNIYSSPITGRFSQDITGLASYGFTSDCMGPTGRNNLCEAYETTMGISVSAYNICADDCCHGPREACEQRLSSAWENSNNEIWDCEEFSDGVKLKNKNGAIRQTVKNYDKSNSVGETCYPYCGAVNCKVTCQQKETRGGSGAFPSRPFKTLKCSTLPPSTDGQVVEGGNCLRSNSGAILGKGSECQPGLLCDYTHPNKIISDKFKTGICISKICADAAGKVQLKKLDNTIIEEKPKQLCAIVSGYKNGVYKDNWQIVQESFCTYQDKKPAINIKWVKDCDGPCVNGRCVCNGDGYCNAGETPADCPSECTAHNKQCLPEGSNVVLKDAGVVVETKPLKKCEGNNVLTNSCSTSPKGVPIIQPQMQPCQYGCDAANLKCKSASDCEVKHSAYMGRNTLFIDGIDTHYDVTFCESGDFYQHECSTDPAKLASFPDPKFSDSTLSSSQVASINNKLRDQVKKSVKEDCPSGSACHPINGCGNYCFIQNEKIYIRYLGMSGPAIDQGPVKSCHGSQVREFACKQNNLLPPGFKDWGFGYNSYNTDQGAVKFTDCPNGCQNGECIQVTKTCAQAMSEPGRTVDLGFILSGEPNKVYSDPLYNDGRGSPRSSVDAKIKFNYGITSSSTPSLSDYDFKNINIKVNRQQVADSSKISITKYVSVDRAVAMTTDFVDIRRDSSGNYLVEIYDGNELCFAKNFLKPCGDGNIDRFWLGEVCDVKNGQSILHSDSDSNKDGKVDCEDLGAKYSGGKLKCDLNTCQNFDESECTVITICGDGVKEGNEECDGIDFGTEACTTKGFTSGNLKCGNCKIKLDDCKVGDCNNGILEGPEICEVKNGETIFNPLLEQNNDGKIDCKDYNYLGGELKCNTSTCQALDYSQCQAQPLCGNKVKDSGEECDDLQGNSDRIPNRCRATCKLPTCGDNICDGNTEDSSCSDCKIACSVAFSQSTLKFWQGTPSTKSYFSPRDLKTYVMISYQSNDGSYKNYDATNIKLQVASTPNSPPTEVQGGSNDWSEQKNFRMITLPVTLPSSTAYIRYVDSNNEVCRDWEFVSVETCKDAFTATPPKITFSDPTSGEVQQIPKGPFSKITVSNQPQPYDKVNLVVEVDGKKSTFDNLMSANINFVNKPSNIKIIDQDTNQVCMEFNTGWIDTTALLCNNNNLCELGEDLTNCTNDCPANTCGNNVCEQTTDYKEDANTCIKDCPQCSAALACDATKVCCNNKCLNPPGTNQYFDSNCVLKDVDDAIVVPPPQPKPPVPERAAAPEREYKTRELEVPVKHCPIAYTIPANKKFKLNYLNPTTYGLRPDELERLTDQQLPVYFTCMGVENMDLISKGIKNVYSKEFRLALQQPVQCQVRVLDHRILVTVDPEATQISTRPVSQEEIFEVVSTQPPAPVAPTPTPRAPTPAPMLPTTPVAPTPQPLIPTPAPAMPVTQPAAPTPATQLPAPQPVLPTPAPAVPKLEYPSKPTDQNPIIYTSEPTKGKTLTVRIKSKSNKPEITVNILTDKSRYPKVLQAKMVEPGIYEVKITPQK